MSEEIHWTKSKYSLSELSRKSVEFRIPVQDFIVHGKGEFFVSRNPEGMLHVELVTDEQGQKWAERIQTRYQLPQVAVDRIAKHPNPSVADFLLQ